MREITKIAREANKLVLKTLKADGIGSGEMDMIHLVRHNPGITQKDAGVMLNMDKGAVARRAKNLEDKGYLIRKANPDDGRSQLLFATEAAEELKRTKTDIEEAFYEWLFSELDPVEKEAFFTTLEKLYIRSKTESRKGFPSIL
ncbi:MAG: MarR family winged helix-turn-helix transcriptional regulator [Bullifex sp.]